jgi:hypothetical protein
MQLFYLKNECNSDVLTISNIIFSIIILIDNKISVRKTIFTNDGVRMQKFTIP